MWRGLTCSCALSIPGLDNPQLEKLWGLANRAVVYNSWPSKDRDSVHPSTTLTLGVPRKAAAPSPARDPSESGPQRAPQERTLLLCPATLPLRPALVLSTCHMSWGFSAHFWNIYTAGLEHIFLLIRMLTLLCR